MTNNRSFINDSDIVRPPEVLDKGFFGFGSSHQIEDGWQGVITEGGIYRETLSSGVYPMSRYSFWRDVKLFVVDTRIQTLKISSKGDIRILQPFPVEISFDMSVEYRVVDPRRIALEIKTPLTNLYDRVIQAAHGVIAQASYNEILTQPEWIASSTLGRLNAMLLPTVVGIEVVHVFMNAISAKDVGDDAIAQGLKKRVSTVEDVQLGQYTRREEWRTENEIASQSRVTWEWLLMNRPEIAQQMIATYGTLAKEMLDKGLLDPSGALMNQPANATGMPNPGALLGGFSPFGQLTAGPTNPSAQPMGSSPPRPQFAPPNDIQARMREEVEFLEKISGAKVEVRKPHADGSYNLCVVVPRISGGTLTIYFVCRAGYPSSAPVVEVEVDGQAMAFQSSLIHRWNGQYLNELVREVRQYFG